MSNYLLIPLKLDESINDELSKLENDGWKTILSQSEPFKSYVFSDDGDTCLTFILKS